MDSAKIRTHAHTKCAVVGSNQRYFLIHTKLHRWSSLFKSLTVLTSYQMYSASLLVNLPYLQYQPPI